MLGKIMKFIVSFYLKTHNLINKSKDKKGKNK